MVRWMFYRIRSLFLPVPKRSRLICTGGNYFFRCSISCICFCSFSKALSFSLSFPFSFFFHFDISVLLLPAVGFLANRGCLASYIDRICSSTIGLSSLSADRLNLFSSSLSKLACFKAENSASHLLVHSLRSTRNSPRKSAIIS
jgi:hypothetical protein